MDVLRNQTGGSPRDGEGETVVESGSKLASRGLPQRWSSESLCTTRGSSTFHVDNCVHRSGDKPAPFFCPHARALLFAMSSPGKPTDDFLAAVGICCFIHRSGVHYYYGFYI